MTDFLHAPWPWPRSVTSELITKSEPPLTVEQGKLLSGLDWAAGDPRDALMAQFINAARQHVELDTGLAVLKQTRRITIEAPAGTVMPLPRQALPLLSMTEEATGTSLPIQVLLPAGSPLPRLPVPSASPRALFDVVHGALSLPYGLTGAWIIEAGWPTTTALADEAPLLLHAIGLLTAHMATLGRDLASGVQAYPVPMGYEAAIQPFRLVWVI